MMGEAMFVGVHILRFSLLVVPERSDSAFTQMEHIDNERL